MGLKESRDRFLAAEKAYDDQYADDAQEIIVKFLNPLHERSESQSDPLREGTEEAIRSLRNFNSVRPDFMSRLANQLGMLQTVGFAAQTNVIGAALNWGLVEPRADRELVPAVKAELEATRRNFDAASKLALQTVAQVEQQTIELLDAATALYVLRSATVATFRSEHLSTPLEKVYDHMTQELENGFRELFTDEVKDELVKMLIEYGGKSGALIAAGVPGIDLIYKLVRGYLKVTKDPEKHLIVGGGDLMLALLGALRKQELLLTAFSDKLDKGFSELQQAYATLTPSSANT